MLGSELTNLTWGPSWVINCIAIITAQAAPSGQTKWRNVRQRSRNAWETRLKRGKGKIKVIGSKFRTPEAAAKAADRAHIAVWGRRKSSAYLNFSLRSYGPEVCQAC